MEHDESPLHHVLVLVTFLDRFRTCVRFDIRGHCYLPKMADIQSLIREVPPVTRFMLVSTALVTL